MSIQTSITPHLVAVAGQPYDAANTVLSGYFATGKLMSVAITAADSQTYTITINGVACSFTAGTGTTTALIAAGLVSAINGSSQGSKVLASGANTPISIESKTGEDFTYSDSATGAGALVETIQVAGGQSAPGGVFMCVDERANRGVMDFAVRLPRQATDVTGVGRFGVTCRPRGFTSPTYSNQIADVMCEGRIWVTVEEAVTAGDPAFVRYAAGAGGSQLGGFRKSADGSTAAQLPAAKYLTDGSAAGLAVLQFDTK